MADLSLIGIYGAGGFGREIISLVDNMTDRGKVKISNTNREIVFVESRPQVREVNGRIVMSEEEFFSTKCKDRFFNVAISNTKSRESIAERLISRDAKPIAIVSPQAVFYEQNNIDEGSIFCAYSMVTSNSKIGKFFHANIYSYVAHDCKIGNFVTFAPGVKCNGNVHIGNFVSVGAGAVIKQGSRENPLVIGEGATIGMGAIVTRDVPPNAIVVGNPARKI